MNEEIETNKVYLQGVVGEEPEFNHKVRDDEFYGFNLKVARLSGQQDIIPIIIPKNLMLQYNIKQGDSIALRGQFRSYNKIENDRRHLVLSVFVKEICNIDESLNSNVIELEGYICKPVIYRTTPFSREICDILLAVNRNFNKSDYIPCIAWGTNAKIASTLNVPAKIKLIGRIQSREYIKHIDNDAAIITKTAYEVSISKLINN